MQLPSVASVKRSLQPAEQLIASQDHDALLMLYLREEHGTAYEVERANAAAYDTYKAIERRRSGKDAMLLDMYWPSRHENCPNDGYILDPDSGEILQPAIELHAATAGFTIGTLRRAMTARANNILDRGLDAENEYVTILTYDALVRFTKSLTGMREAAVSGAFYSADTCLSVRAAYRVWADMNNVDQTQHPFAVKALYQPVGEFLDKWA